MVANTLFECIILCMRPPDNSPISNYELVEWNRPMNKYRHTRVVKMSQYEAESRNYAFAINRADKRYVKQ